MKKSLALFFIATSFLLGCKKEEPVVIPPAIKTVEQVLNLSYTSQKAQIVYSIENPVEGESLKAVSSESWINVESIGTQVIYLKVTENNSGDKRTGKLTLSYADAVNVVLSINQSYTASEITCEPSSLTTDYTKKENQFFAFSVSAEREGCEIKAESENDWITNVTISKNTVRYTVQDNNSGEDREGTISLTYGSAVQEFKVYQKYTAAVITTSINSETVNCLATNLSFTCDVANQHDGVNLQVETNASWISDLKLKENTVSYSLSKNTTGADRTGTITVTYGIVSKTVTIKQTYPIVTFEPATTNTSYLAKDLKITVTVTNPVPGATLYFTPNVQWLNYRSYNDNTFTFSVDNNATSERTGKFHVSYGVFSTSQYYATTEYTVVQRAMSTDLSSNATSNCYMVNKAGEYQFKATEGNSSTAVSGVASVEVLWESFGTSTAPNVGDLVNNVEYTNGYITFAATSTKGNAVIAAKNASNTILWSWHIWLTSPILELPYKNNAGTVMDAYLGALDDGGGIVNDMGLLYQWGRKDPFLSGDKVSFNTVAKSTGTWRTQSSSSSYGTISYATKNPTTFITSNNANGDWYYTGTSDTDNTRWSSESKTKYDPCPVGYKVLKAGPGGVWETAVGGYYWNYTWGGNGAYITNLNDWSWSCWFQASGRYDESGKLVEGGSAGYVWSATPYNNQAYIFTVSSSHATETLINRTCGASVRCVKE